MTAANEPLSPASEAPASIALPPLPAPPEQAGDRAAVLAGLDRGLVVVVLLLAFLLASFVARNSDLWLHLASGRLLAQGKYTFGIDPFTYTSADTYWVNPSWLWDLLTYGIFTAGGGPDAPLGGTLLVVLKALLVTALAGVMLQIRRRDQGLWTPALCTGISLLFMGPRLHLQSTCISFLFLGLTLYLLTRTASWRFAALLALFVLWVNLDSWFLLGPLVVFLYFLGEAVQRVLPWGHTVNEVRTPHELWQLAEVVVAGLTVCMLNPHHVRVFTSLPTELAVWTMGADAREDAWFRPYFQSPVLDVLLLVRDGRNWTNDIANTWTALAYFVFLGFGLWSFSLTRRKVSWWRLLLWTVFAALGAWQTRCIPFFAILAGPIVALNLQDYAAQMAPNTWATRRWKVWVLGGRVVSLVAGLALLGTAWAGWNHSRSEDPRHHRRVAWRVEVDPSLRGAAEKLRALRAEGKLHDDEHGFNYTPDLANYWAWFCPAEKSFLDSRLQLSRKGFTDYVQLRRLLFFLSKQAAEQTEPLLELKPTLRDLHVTHVALNLNDPWSSRVWQRLWMDPEHWLPLFLDGRSAVFYWKESATQPSAALDEQTLDLEARAFDRQAERAPETGVAPTAPRDWWQRFAVEPPPLSHDLDETLIYLQHYEDLTSARHRRIANSWVYAFGTGMIAAPAGEWERLAAFPDVLLRLRLLFHYLRGEVSFLPPSPSNDPAELACLMLAIRAGRRSAAVNPDAPAAYLWLAAAYEALWKRQENIWTPRPLPTAAELAKRPPRWGRRPQPVALSLHQTLRQVQTIAAAQRLLAQHPDNIRTHLQLARIYFDVPSLPFPLRPQPFPYDELALEHLNLARQIAQTYGIDEISKNQIEQLQHEFADLAEQVKAAREEYDFRSRDRRVSDKLVLALERGLTRVALDLLQNAKPSDLGPSDVQTYLYLLLATGKIDDMQAIMGPAAGPPLLREDNDWFRTLLAAASGNYREADEALTQFTKSLRKPSLQRYIELMGALLLEPPLGKPLAYQARQRLDQVYQMQQLQQIAGVVVQLAQLEALRGMLALESGDNVLAQQCFEDALALAGPRIPFETRPMVTTYLHLLRSKSKEITAKSR